MLYTVEALAIRSIDYGEGNKIITLLTREMGKVAVMARGAKKLNSRLALSAQPFTHGMYTFYLSRAGKMGTLNSTELLNGHHALREDLELMAYASYLAELTDRMINDREGSAFLFEQLTSAFAAIEEGKDCAVIMQIYELRMLQIAGYAPVLDACASCGIAIDATSSATWRFSARSGGVICANCGTSEQKAIPITPVTRKLLLLFQQLDLRNVGNINVKETTKQQVSACIRSFIDEYIDIAWKSRRFIEQLDKYKKI